MDVMSDCSIKCTQTTDYRQCICVIVTAEEMGDGISSDSVSCQKLIGYFGGGRISICGERKV